MNATNQIFSDDDVGVGFAAIAATVLNLSDLNTVLNTIVLAGTALYIWKKALRKRKP